MAVGALVIVAAPVVIATGTAVLAAAGMSAASLTIVGGAIEGGLLAYAAYDVGKTAVEFKADLDAGRLDAADGRGGFLNALREKLEDIGRQLHADATDFGHFLGGRFTQLLNTTEGGQQGVATLGPQPGHFVED